MNAPPFRRIGPVVPRTPVVIAVPHAGRHYPDALAAAARVPIDRLVALEDRHVDQLIDDAVAGGATAIVAVTARAWIDLNRHPSEVDPTMIAPQPAAMLVRDGPRIRAGLGLVPRRIAGVGEILSGRIAADDLAERIATVHRPYHAALADALASARTAHGVAVLLDLHSMPPLRGGDSGVEIVVGDLNGTSAAQDITTALLDAARTAGYRATRNRPYAGGHGVAEHGRPRVGVHAVQLEICRTAYLDGALDRPGAGLARARAFVAAVYSRLSAALPHGHGAHQAAE
ncbi:MAG TPA: N-formylglutamate amidohydrolase [Sphingomonas sp.]|jgi:N-formylglutamate amidohydrolase|uniref:N-formylglutamate amidohydrolase n=1 Tax=Sphingomonas sp. TaxID=28214 RepID=UPI002ED92BBC